MFRAPEVVRPLLLQGLLFDRPVHAWDNKAMGEGVEEAAVLCRVSNTRCKDLRREGTGPRSLSRLASCQDSHSTQMWQRRLQLKNSCDQLAVASCLDSEQEAYWDPGQAQEANASRQNGSSLPLLPEL